MTDIEILERAENYVGDHYINGVAEAYIYPPLKRAINAGIAALRNQRDLQWISVEDRLPEDGVWVLAACDDGIVRLGISKGGFPSVVNRAHRFSDVTHWMPLPTPPKEASHET